MKRNSGLIILILFVFLSSSYSENRKVTKRRHIQNNKETIFRKNVRKNGGSRLMRKHQNKTKRAETCFLSKSNPQKTSQSLFDDDFLVNTDMSGGSHQWRPEVAIDSSGNFVVVWEDERNGQFDIFLQRYHASGEIAGSNRIVNDNPDITYQGFPDVAMNKRGDFVIVWEDCRDNHYDVYFQRFNAAGEPQGSNQRANEDIDGEEQWDANVVMDEQGQFIITWNDFRDGNGDIYFQMFNANGTTIGINTQVNSDTEGADQWMPVIARDNDGNFIIAWEDEREENGDIYSQIFNSNGEGIGDNQRMNEWADGEDQWSPSVAMETNGDFVVVWEDYREAHDDIFFQRGNISEGKQGANQKVHKSATVDNQWAPAVAMDADGRFVIVWEGEREDDVIIFRQDFNPTGLSVENSEAIENSFEPEGQWSPCVTMNASGQSVIAWEDWRNCNQDIYCQRYEPHGIKQGDNIKVNDDVGSAHQLHPALATNDSGQIVIAWEDSRNCDWDVYYSLYSKAGTVLISNERVNDDEGVETQWDPSVAMDKDGNFVIAWEDQRDGFSDIFFQRFDATGTRQGGNIQVDAVPDDTNQDQPVAMMNRHGDFILAWDDGRNENWDIFARAYDSFGNAKGGSWRVNDDEIAGNFQGYCAGAMNKDGAFVISWWDERDGWGDVYFQSFNTAGAKQGQNLRANDVPHVAYWDWPGYPDVAITDGGNFAIAWEDIRSQEFVQIYSQRFSQDGTRNGANIKISPEENKDHFNPCVAYGENGMQIIWENWHKGWLTDWNEWLTGQPDLFIQHFDPDGLKMGDPQNVVDDGPNHSERFPEAVVNSEYLIVAWEDTRRSKGMDIFMKKIPFDTTGTHVTHSKNGLLPKHFVLYQNTPNPFNPDTRIEFEVFVKSRVTLTIYETNGREIGVLLDEIKGSGKHTVLFNGTHLPSGIYFYQIEINGYTEVKKMILIE